MDFSKVKLVVSDMDGTLLNSNHQISAQFLDLYHILKTKNILFVAASGRTHKSITEKLLTIKEAIIVVSENGALVIQRENLLLSTPILETNFKKIVQLTSILNETYPVYCGKNHVYVKQTKSSSSY